jgi:hypothetical protein
MQSRITKIALFTLFVAMLLGLYGGEIPAKYGLAVSVSISAHPTSGPAPLTVSFSASGSPPLR